MHLFIKIFQVDLTKFSVHFLCYILFVSYCIDTFVLIYGCSYCIWQCLYGLWMLILHLAVLVRAMDAHTASDSACMGYGCSYCIWQCLYVLYVTYISVLCVPLPRYFMLLFIFFTVCIINLCSCSLLLYGYCSNLYQHCQYYMIHSWCLLDG